MKKVIIATSRAISGARLSRRVSDLGEFAVCGLAQDMSSAYILTEQTEPSVALVGSEFARLPEFEGLISLFRFSQTAWLEIPDSLSVVLQVSGARPGPSGDDLRAWLETARQPRVTVSRLTAGLPTQVAPSRPADDRLILIGASTGGIDALITILTEFPENCPPTLIVQHTGAGFSQSLVRLFARCTAARVVAASEGQALTPGTIIIAAGCPGHLRLNARAPFTAELVAGQAVTGHMPSIDALFHSALPLASKVTAALLTGMGRDGAEGLLALRRAGATTFAQDEASSVVYGMPRAAVEIGAVSESLPLTRIARELLSHSLQPHPLKAAR